MVGSKRVQVARCSWAGSGRHVVGLRLGEVIERNCRGGGVQEWTSTGSSLSYLGEMLLGVKYGCARHNISSLWPRRRWARGFQNGLPGAAMPWCRCRDAQEIVFGRIGDVTWQTVFRRGRDKRRSKSTAGGWDRRGGKGQGVQGREIVLYKRRKRKQKTGEGSDGRSVSGHRKDTRGRRERNPVGVRYGSNSLLHTTNSACEREKIT